MTDSDLQQKRLVAAAIDAGLLVGIGMVLAALLGVFGYAASRSDVVGFGMGVGTLLLLGTCLVFALGRDAILGSQSIGKKIAGVRVVAAAGASIGAMESVRRNVVFAPAFILWMLGAFIELLPLLTCGACLALPIHLLGAVLALGSIAYELYLVAQDPEGIRTGDKIAGTRVVRDTPAALPHGS